MLAYAVALALGVTRHGMRPRRPCRVVIFNAENAHEEQSRRLSTILTSRGRTPEHVASRIIRLGPSRAATLFVRDDDKDEPLPTPALKTPVEAVQAYQPDVQILVSLSELHSEQENVDFTMRDVVAWLRTMARQHHLALTLVHHARKGLVVPGDIDRGRGRPSLSVAARIMLTATGDAITLYVQTKVEEAIRRGHPSRPLSPRLGVTNRSVNYAMEAADITTRRHTASDACPLVAKV